MRKAAVPALLRDLLPGVSRSLALSLQILPEPLRGPFGLTYLLARAADTIADTRALAPGVRRARLQALRAALGQGGSAPAPSAPDGLEVPGHVHASERQLLQRLGEVLGAFATLPADDRARAQVLLATLTQAMLEALERFPAETEGRIAALATAADLDRYTYMNAGCVGEFWTDMVVAHRRSCRRVNAALLRARGARFGQGLQLTNVLRDLPRDLRMGRCLLPRAALQELRLVPEDLLDPESLPRLRPLLATLQRRAVQDLGEGLRYTQALPRSEARLRLATSWPLLLGLATVRHLARAGNPLDPGVTVKVSRLEVRRHILASLLLIASNRGLEVYVRRLERRADPAR